MVNEIDEKEELLECLGGMAKFCEKETWWDEEWERGYNKIVALIKKPQVTEEWIEEKAMEIYNLSYYKSFKLQQIADCIRSLVKEVQ